MNTVNPNENFLMRRATGLAIGTLTLIMMIMALIYWRQSEAGIAAKNAVTHTYGVIGHIEALSNSLKDAELGKRGFLITADELFLESYFEALRDGREDGPESDSIARHHSIKQEVAILRKLTKDNPSQQSNLDELETTLKDLLQFMTNAIEAKRNMQDKSTIPNVNLLHGKQMMDKIRGTLRIMTAEENHLLALRLEADEIHTHQNLMFTFMAMLAFYLIMTLSILLYQSARARSTVQLLHYTQELEHNEEVLKMQQEELKASNEEIEASNEELEEKTKALEEQNIQIRRQTGEIEEARRTIEEKAAALELSSKYKSEFLANMSHELRTPLNSLLILAKGLASNDEGNLTEEQIEEARVIHTGGLELLGLINDILDLSKVEAGKISILPEHVHFADIAKKMSQQFEPIARQSKLSFPIEIDQHLPATFYTDSQRVEQILKNLLSNAFKFTSYGSVTLRIHRPGDEVLLQRANLSRHDSIAFSVTDTGIGIDPTKLKDIFEAFQQEEGSTDRHYGGTGLGLTIARKFAQILGGEIHVASRKGQGSTFTLFLPLTLSEQPEAPPAPVEKPKPLIAESVSTPVAKADLRSFIPDDRKSVTAADKVLLIIEDDREFAITLSKIARKRGYKVLCAGDGKSGLLIAAEYPVTAIILDLRLPDINGMNVLAQLKHSLATRHIPVHIISGLAETDTVVPLHQGAIGYLTKPPEQEGLDQVFARIESMLQSQVKKLLVVEDDPSTQLAIDRLLKQKDITITITDSGKGGLEKLAAHTFDCIILDLKLPDMSGFEWLTTAEQQQGEGSLPPVIVYTARELTESEHRELTRYTGSIVIKGASSPERLLDEVTLFLHSVESTLSKDQQAIIRMQHDPDHALQNRTVLLVDDDMRNIFALSKLLKRHGMQVEIADNGKMALDVLRARKSIELVIMDIMMPIMDGYQAMREIRATEAWASLPIIALTARAMPEEQERCMEAGANDYLMKPVDTDRLLALLRVWLFRQERVA